YILSDAEIIHSFPELLTTPEYYLIGSQIIEFVLKAVDFEEPNAKLFNLLLAVLFTLTKTQSKAFLESLALAFYLKAGSFLGYRPELNNCVICRKSLSKFSRARPIFDKSLGGLLCPTCKTKTQNSWELTYDQLLHLKALLYLPLKMALTLEPKPELNNLILQYLKHHFPKLDLKTECYFRWNNQA
ncbi:MAG: DNA repair protein RecO C-terminal domain-containing protein, partial [candidate division WOR-3 bacterium]